MNKEQIRKQKIVINSDEDASRLKRLLDSLEEPIYTQSNLNIGKSSSSGKYHALFAGNVWQYNYSSIGDISVEDFEKLVTKPVMNKEDIKVFVKSKEAVIELRKVLVNADERMGSAITQGVYQEHFLPFVCFHHATGWIFSDGTDRTEVTINGLEQLLLSKPKQTMEKKQTVTREALGEIYPNVCPTWQVKIAKLLEKNLFKDVFPVPQTLIEEVYGVAHDRTQKEWLDKYLPKPEPQFKVGDKVCILDAGLRFTGSKIELNDIKTIKSFDNEKNTSYKQNINFTDGSWGADETKNNFVKYFRLATKEEIEQAQCYPDGTPCLIRSHEGASWQLNYADGKGNFYEFGKKSGNSIRTKPCFYQRLDIYNLPVNE